MKMFYLKVRRLFYLINYMSISKIVNLLKLIITYLFSFSELKLFQNIYPHFISIEAANFCNLHCPECPVGNGKKPKIGKAVFDHTLYEKIIDELAPALQHVILYFQGEPFLHNQLTGLIHYAHKANIYTSTSTNGQFLNKITAGNLVLSGLDKLIISIDGTTQQVYETYRVGSNLQNAIDGINCILEAKKELKSITPMVEIQFLVLKTNEHQMNDMKQLAKSLKVDKLTFKTAQLNDFENGNELLTSISRFARYRKANDGKYIIKGRQPNHCWRMRSGAVINVQGEVLPCCFDKFSEYSFGNMNDKNFLECWQSKEALDFRSEIKNNRRQFDMCRNCTS
jgi:radical SAM protein with 4Fe4S-binding SPASM domain